MGTRDVVARIWDVKIYLERVWQLRVDELDRNTPKMNSHVFCRPDGNPTQSFKKGFSTLISEAGVEYN